MANFFVLILTALIAISVSVEAQTRQIPPASLPCSDDVKQWWEQVRAAGAEAAKALGQKEAILKNKRRGKVDIPDDEDELLSKKEREYLNTNIPTAIGNYLSLLRMGKEKGYLIPLPDNRVISLQPAPVRYTYAARKARAQGLSIAFQPDGTVTVMKIVSGLGFGLDEKAVAAAQKIVFLPAIKDGAFVNTTSNVEYSFSLY